jgi:hypothetical protein
MLAIAGYLVSGTPHANDSAVDTTRAELVPTMREEQDPEWYLQDPRTRKWMAQCVGCHRWGYHHDAPPEFFGRAPLEKHIGKLNLDERGLCDQCREAQSVLDS